MKYLFFILTLISLISCNSKVIEVQNLKEGSLVSTNSIKMVSEKSFILDSTTAPKSKYSQIYLDNYGKRYFTFFNRYDNSICFYDYENLNLINKIKYQKKGPNGILMPMGYHIKNMDSIFIYNKHQNQLVLTNREGVVLNRISLINNSNIKNNKWILKYPQYYPRTVTPLFEYKDKLLLTGQFMWSMPDSLIDTFKFTTEVNLKDNNLSFKNYYPQELYGFGVNWDHVIYKEVFSDLNNDRDFLVLSFPISHDLYISDLNTNQYRKVYGGSNFAGTITSVNTPKGKSTPERKEMQHVEETDLYSAIKYDKYDKVYYRFIRRALRKNDINFKWKDKELAIIAMDENFKYLGETNIGKWGDWNWENSFVTKEGLNIEFLNHDDINEVALILKIFKIEK
ncbi:DUF4221 family protein [Formosa haliotis]|uniref:DUF4221 family protein n=1 Tax=Formosa haliotis TaxID=1555194 RepID=UPI00082716AB|nr:DUF4221 family protein [Formosa haliotis]